MLPLPLPNYILWIFAAAGVTLLVRFLLLRKPVESALLWSLFAFFLAMHFGGQGRIALAYSATAALILAVSIIETSYLLAYHDELTTRLPWSILIISSSSTTSTVTTPETRFCAWSLRSWRA